MKRILIIAIISLFFLTPLLWYGSYVIGTNYTDELFLKYRNEKYSTELAELKKEQDKVTEWLVETGDIKGVFNSLRIYERRITIINNKAWPEFLEENNGIQTRYKYIYPSVVTLLYFTLLLILVIRYKKKS